jgi:hypothetical protein
MLAFVSYPKPGRNPNVAANLRIVLASVLLLCLAGGVGIGCGSEPPPVVSPQAAEFRKQVLSMLKLVDKRLGPLATPEQEPQLRQAVRELCEKTLAKGTTLPYGLAVIGADGKTLAGAIADPQAAGGVNMVKVNKDYSKYEKLQQALKGEGVAHFTLYTGDGKVYMVCSPFKTGGSGGAACLAFQESTLPDSLKIGEKEFESLNFN